MLLKRVLIISPYFPPFNTADMQRVRMSLSYFEDFGWQTEVVTVANEYLDAVEDPFLMESIPNHQIIHKVSAFSKKWTCKLGLGSIALRSLWFYRQKVNHLLHNGKYDLIYFSTTQFPVCILGAYWKKKFGIPYVIDMQDPWHSDYYQDKPKNQRPPKYWFSYRLNKWLEPIAMKSVDGLIAVSQAYITTLKQRYPQINNVPSAVITFGAFAKDFEIAEQHRQLLTNTISLSSEHINIVYLGRGGFDMKNALTLIFKAFKNGLADHVGLSKIRFYFFGTSYAPNGRGIKTIYPIAQDFELTNFVIEETDRIPFYQTLSILKKADALIIPGSNDPKYTASKIYPYILANKPLLALFNEDSAPYKMIIETNAGYCAPLNQKENAESLCRTFYLDLLKKRYSLKTDWAKFERYSAKQMAKQQSILFESATKHID